MNCIIEENYVNFFSNVFTFSSYLWYRKRSDGDQKKKADRMTPTAKLLKDNMTIFADFQKDMKEMYNRDINNAEKYRTQVLEMKERQLGLLSKLVGLNDHRAPLDLSNNSE